MALHRKSDDLAAIDSMVHKFPTLDFIFVESGGDNLAPLVGASLDVMQRDTLKMRGERPWVFTNIKERQGPRSRRRVHRESRHARSGASEAAALR
jgi:Ni2+-binding GTPase involved in maturation of urease and hydrogenase